MSLNVTTKELKKWQKQDPTLVNIRKIAERPARSGTRRVCFQYRGGLLYRLGQSERDQINKQLVLPVQCRKLVLRLAHHSPLTGHLSISKTKNCILQHYYWPGMFRDTAEYCQTCELCEKTFKADRTLMSHPSQRIAVDSTGLESGTQKESQYVSTTPDAAAAMVTAQPMDENQEPVEEADRDSKHDELSQGLVVRNNSVKLSSNPSLLS